MNLTGKTILLTGGTGSFGKSFAKFLLQNHPVKKIIIFSRDEFKQHQMQAEIRDENLKMRYFIGDVRDLSRLERAFKGVDIVIHAAALKQVPAIEYNPFEAVKTNILGTQNVIEAAIDQGVEKVLLVSTDKAVLPINLYGATKLAAERLFISANFYSPGITFFSIVRYGNVLGSRGSVIESIVNNAHGNGVVKVTDPNMTRFWLTIEESYQLVLFGLKNMEGGEIFIPKIPSMKLADLFEAIAPAAKKEIIGLRPGEKMHECLMTESESRNAYLYDSYYVILPEIITVENAYAKYYRDGKKLSRNFKYVSDSNKVWLTAKKLKKQIEAYTT